MLKSVSFAFLLFLTAWEHSEGLTCYNCYTLYTSTSTSFHGRGSRGEVVTPCADNITDSNTYVCADANSVCTLMHLKLGNQHELLRGCAKETADVCNTGIPGGMEVVSCSTCKTDLCNGDNNDEDPDPPANNSSCPTWSFDVNLNINLNVYHVNAPNPIA